MSWLDAHAIHIYAPTPQNLNDDWVRSVLGDVIRPIHQQYRDNIEWMWLTRYSGPLGALEKGEGDLPGGFKADSHYRRVLFRISAHDDIREDLHNELQNEAGKKGYHIPNNGWSPYDVLGDLAGPR